KMARVPVRRLVARPTLAEIDLAGDAGVDHPLQRAVDRRPADARRLALDALEQIVGADVPLLTQEHFDDPIALGRGLATARAQRGKIWKLPLHVVNWRVGDVVIDSPIHQFANSPIVR